MKKALTLLTLFLTLWTCAANAQAPKCELDGPLRFGGLDWDSARFHVAVASFIAEHGYGCKSEVTPGSTIPLITGLTKGNLDVIMEIWTQNNTEAWEKGEKAGKVKYLGINFPDAIQGWFVPRYVVEGDNAPAKGLRSVQDLKKFKAVFADPEEPSKGRFYNGIYGWRSEKVNTYRLKGYGLDKDFTNFRPGTAAALSAAIASAYKRKKPILYFYWGPSWLLGKFDGVMLDEPPHDPELWKKVKIGEADKACAFPVTKVAIGANTKFTAKAPKLVAFFKNYKTSNALTSEALVFMKETDGATADDAAKHFLKTHPEIWTKWIPEEAATRVKSALN